MPTVRLRGGLAVVVLLLASLVGHAQSLGGDVNADGVVDMRDALLVLRHVDGVIALTAEEQARADVAPLPGTSGRAVGDGKVDIDDARKLARHLVGLVDLGELTGQLVGPAVTGFDPTVGSPGTVVKLAGANFVAGSTSENLVELNGLVCPVTAAMASELTVSVPEGATSGYFTVTTPGGTDNSDTAFEVATIKTGQLVLPARMRGRQSLSEYVVETDLGSGNVDGQGGFSAPFTSAPLTFVVARRGTGGDGSLLALYLPGAGGKFQISAHSTAVALVLLHPAFMPRDDYPLEDLLATIESLAQFPALVVGCENAIVQGALLSEDADVQTALKAVWEALATRLESSRNVVPPTSAREEGEGGGSSRAYLQKADVQALTVSLQERDKDLRLVVANRALTAVDWLARIVAIDPQAFPNGFADLKKFDPATVYPRLQYVNAHMVSAKGLFNLASIYGGDIVLGVLDYASSHVSPQLSILSQPGVPLNPNEGRLHLLRAFSGALPTTDSAEEEFATKFLPGRDNDFALVLNLVALSLDIMKVLAGNVVKEEAWHKVARSAAFEAYKKLIQLGVVKLGRGRDTGDALGVIWDVTLSVVKKVSEELAKELATNERLKQMAKSLVSGIKIANKVVTWGKMADRALSLVTGYPTAGILNVFFRDAVGKVTPLETTLVVVGDPFSPALTGYPKRVKPNQTVALTGKRLGVVGDSKVFFGEAEGTVTSANDAGTELRVRVPDMQPGYVLLKVKKQSGTVEADDLIEVVRPPEIDSVTPGYGYPLNPSPPVEWPAPAGTSVTIRGRYFRPAGTKNDTVLFGGDVAGAIDEANSSAAKLVVQVPTGASSGQLKVKTQVEDPEKAGTFFETVSKQSFQTIDSPTLTGLSPPAGPGGTPLILAGRNLGVAEGETRVFFKFTGDTKEAEGLVRSISPTSLVVEEPLMLKSGELDRTVDVRVSTRAGDFPLTGQFTLREGVFGRGSTIYVTTAADSVAADNDLSLREAILLATQGVAGLVRQRGGSPLTDNEAQRIQPGQFDGNNVWKIHYPPGPAARDTVTFSGGVGTPTLTGSLPPLDAGYDTIGGAVDASQCTGPALRVTSDGNGVGLDVTNCPHAAIEVAGNYNWLGGVFGKMANCLVAVKVQDGSFNSIGGRIESCGVGVEITGDSRGNRVGAHILKSTSTMGLPVSGVGVWVHGDKVVDTELGYRNTDATFSELRVEQSAAHGVLVEAGPQRTSFELVDARDNLGDGIRIVGGTATRQSAPSQPTADTRIYWGTCLRNGGNGLTIAGGATGTRWKQRTGTNHPQYVGENKAHGILIEGNCYDSQLYGVRIELNGKSGVAVLHSAAGDPLRTRLEHNFIWTNEEYGVLVSAAAQAREDGVWATGNDLGGNVLAGARIETPGQFVSFENNTVPCTMTTAAQRRIVSDTGIESVGAKDVTLRGNSVQLSGREGIRLLANTTGAIVAGGSATDSGTDGVLLDHATNCSLQGVESSRNNGSGIVIRNSSDIRLAADASFVPTVAAGQTPHGSVEQNKQDGVRVESGCTRVAVLAQHLNWNGVNGVAIEGPNTSNTTVRLCEITNNTGDGVQVATSALSTTLGGAETMANRIASNHQFGVHLLKGPAPTAPLPGNAVVAGNLIGTDATGNDWSSWQQAGIVVESGWRRVVIGGHGLPGSGGRVGVESGNVVSGHGGPCVRLLGPDISDVTIDGNFLGLSLSGDKSLSVGTAGGAGVEAAGAIDGLRLGQSTGNRISGNGGPGIDLTRVSSAQISGNLVGLSAKGTRPVGNGAEGIRLTDCPNAVVKENRLADNKGGLLLTGAGTSGASVENNVFGLAAGGQILGQRGAGIIIAGGANGHRLTGNTVTRCVGAVGIDLGAGTGKNSVLQGSIYDNEKGGIQTANPSVPTITTVLPTVIKGTAPASVPRGIVQVYGDRGAQGEIFVGSAPVFNGKWTLNAPRPRAPMLTATITDADGNTSAFSTPVLADPETTNPPVTPMVFTSTRDGNREVYLRRSVFSPTAVRLTQHQATDQDPALSPNFRTVAFASSRDGDLDIYTMGANGANDPTRLTTAAGDDFQPSWSPDGNRLAFVSTRDGNPELFVMYYDGTQQTQLTQTDNTLANLHPTWSPDGTKIAFTSGPWTDPAQTGFFRQSGQTNADIFLLNVANGAVVANLTQSPSNDDEPAWNDTGDKLLFVRDRDGNPEIYAMNADGSGVKRLTDEPATDTDPAWLPDGQILFASDREQDRELFLMRDDGSFVRRLTVTLGLNFQPNGGRQ